MRQVQVLHFLCRDQFYGCILYNDKDDLDLDKYVAMSSEGYSATDATIAEIMLCSSTRDDCTDMVQ